MSLKQKRLVLLLALLVGSIAVFALDRLEIRVGIGPSDIREFTAEDITSRFIQIYHSAPHRVPWTTKWFGIPTIQTPTDMWSTQEIICETQPDFIIETGTFKGGSALYFATILHGLRDTARVITVDIEDQAEPARKHPLFQEHVIALVGSSLSDAILSEISSRVAGKSAMVFLDSDHHKDHVLKELNAYAGFVSPGNYLIVNDTFCNGHPVLEKFGPGPMEAVREFLKTNRNFMVDTKRNRFMLTFYPGGYLKRTE